MSPNTERHLTVWKQIVPNVARENELKVRMQDPQLNQEREQAVEKSSKVKAYSQHSS